MELIAAIWGILGIILFFKVWGACNNIKRLADKYAPQPGNKKGSQLRSTVETREELEKWLNESK